MIRYCEDCRWYKEINGCDAPQNHVTMKEGLVRRSSLDLHGYRWLSASYQRGMSVFMAIVFRSCGRSARWYVPRSPQGSRDE